MENLGLYDDSQEGEGDEDEDDDDENQGIVHQENEDSEQMKKEAENDALVAQAI